MFLDHADAILNSRSYLIGSAEVCVMSSAVDTDIRDTFLSLNPTIC